MQKTLTDKPPSEQYQYLKAFLILGFAMFILALLGILSRPFSFLASIWIANAALLGLLLRFPQLHNLGGIIGAFLGFMCADLLTKNTFELTFVLTISNLISALVTYYLILLFRLDFRNFNQGLTFLYLFLLCTFGGSLISAVFAVSTVPYLPNTFMAPDRFWTDFGMWRSGEAANYVVFLPIFLALPTFKILKTYWSEKKEQPYQLSLSLPLIAIGCSVVFTHFFNGPGAIMFPIAALIWASLTYNLFIITIINCIICVILYHSLTTFYVDVSPEAYLMNTMSIRMGLSMLALGPLTLSIINLNRQKLYHQILYLANHDSLTTTMNRRYFFEESEKTVQSVRQTARSVTILLLDIDHFKKINDQYGHHAGDIVLQQFTQVIAENLRQSDLFGRLGGEEFAILLKNLSLTESIQIAQRLCHLVYDHPITLPNNEVLHISVSIGLSYQTCPYYIPFQQLINRADDALYEAKETGRNKLCIERQLHTVSSAN